MRYVSPYLHPTFHSVIVDQCIPATLIAHVWMKVGHVIGSPIPGVRRHQSAEQLAVAKASSDLLWAVSLEEMITDTD
jgi:hypothetical protein